MVAQKSSGLLNIRTRFELVAGQSGDAYNLGLSAGRAFDKLELLRSGYGAIHTEINNLSDTRGKVAGNRRQSVYYVVNIRIASDMIFATLSIREGKLLIKYSSGVARINFLRPFTRAINRKKSR